MASSLIHELAHHIVVVIDPSEVEGHGHEFLDNSEPGWWLVSSNVPIPGGGDAGARPGYPRTRAR